MILIWYGMQVVQLLSPGIANLNGSIKQGR